MLTILLPNVVCSGILQALAAACFEGLASSPGEGSPLNSVMCLVVEVLSNGAGTGGWSCCSPWVACGDASESVAFRELSGELPAS